MDPFGNDEIARLLRLKRYEQPPPSYYENFLSEFRRRQRDELLRQPAWRICFERVQGFALQRNVRSLASYVAGISAAVMCAAVISIRIYQQPQPAQLAVESSPVPSTLRANAQRGFHLAPPTMPWTFNAERILLPRSRDIPLRPLLPAEPLWSDEIRLKPKWESLDDQLLLEK
jgi:hypothetical protein